MCRFGQCFFCDFPGKFLVFLPSSIRYHGDSSVLSILGVHQHVLSNLIDCCALSVLYFSCCSISRARADHQCVCAVLGINHSGKPCVGYCVCMWLSAANSVMIVDSVSAFPHRLREVSRGGCARCAWACEPLGANVNVLCIGCYHACNDCRPFLYM